MSDANKIGDKTFEKAGEMLTAIMKSYRSKINQAYLAADEELKIGLSLSISPATNMGSFNLEAGINFIAEKIKDQFSATVEELQGELPLDEEPEEGGAGDAPQGPGMLTEPQRLLERPDTTDTIDAQILNEFGCDRELVDGICPRCQEEELICPEGIPCCSVCGKAHDCSWRCPKAKASGDESNDETEAETESSEGETKEDHPLLTFRILDIASGEWWEGQARTAEEACAKAWGETPDGSKAKWNIDGCEIKIKSDTGAGGWKKYKADPDHPIISCQDCNFHRGMINKAHGVKVPGNSGKCIREGGPCEKATEKDLAA